MHISTSQQSFLEDKYLLTPIYLNLWKKLLKIYPWSAALYGREKDDRSKLPEKKNIEAFKMWLYRKIMKIR